MTPRTYEPLATRKIVSNETPTLSLISASKRYPVSLSLNEYFFFLIYSSESYAVDFLYRSARKSNMHSISLLTFSLLNPYLIASACNHGLFSIA